MSLYSELKKLLREYHEVEAKFHDNDHLYCHVGGEISALALELEAIALVRLKELDNEYT